MSQRPQLFTSAPRPRHPYNRSFANADAMKTARTPVLETGLRKPSKRFNLPENHRTTTSAKRVSLPSHSRQCQ